MSIDISPAKVSVHSNGAVEVQPLVPVSSAYIPTSPCTLNMYKVTTRPASPKIVAKI